ncbi:MAG TPA: nucleoside phosphorylase [Ohtaekwangia sp.]|nr:nucleoside phosphorylase [Ohtaekwangia sp.]
MSTFSPAELILHPDGSIYHLNLRPEHIGDTIISVGDQNRVAEVSRFFDEVSFRMNQREFVTHTGTLRGKRISVISTGIGTDNIEIFLTELDALVNVDLKTRTVKPEHRSLDIIRIGTSGAIREDIPVGTHLVSANAIGFDNLMQFYALEQNSKESEMGQDLQDHLGLPFTPYVVGCSEALLEKVAFDMYRGNTVTAPGFYAPQGRRMRIPVRFPELLTGLMSFSHESGGLTNLEMETAGYYALGRLLNHRVLSVNAIIANRVRNEFAPDHAKVVENLIQKVLSRL